MACQSLADNKAPFLIEIPRSHVSFEKGALPPYIMHPQNDVHLTVAAFFTSEWQTSETRCPTIKRVYMVVVKNSFKTSFENYR